MVVTRYFNSEFMCRAKAEKIIQTFEKGINKLNSESFIQISSDGPNINLCFLELFAEKKKESEELPPLIQIGTCGLHTIHGSIKAGVKNSNWNTGFHSSTFCYNLFSLDIEFKMLLGVWGGDAICFG